MTIMRKSLGLLSLSLLTVAFSTGCANMGPSERTGTAVGAVGGAVAGAALTEGSVEGAGLGAAAGAVVGNAVGRGMDDDSSRRSSYRRGR